MRMCATHFALVLLSTSFKSNSTNVIIPHSFVHHIAEAVRAIKASKEMLQIYLQIERFDFTKSFYRVEWNSYFIIANYLRNKDCDIAIWIAFYESQGTKAANEVTAFNLHLSLALNNYESHWSEIFGPRKKVSKFSCASCVRSVWKGSKCLMNSAKKCSTTWFVRDLHSAVSRFKPSLTQGSGNHAQTQIEK